MLRCKYDPAEPEPLGYKQVAQRLRWRIGVVRSVERAIRHKMDRFAAVYTAGRLCDARASDIGSLAAGTADRRQARAAFAHVATCGHCRPIYAAQLRALRSAAFERKVAALLPLPSADAQQRGRLRGAWDAFADTITRPFTHDGTATAHPARRRRRRPRRRHRDRAQGRRRPLPRRCRRRRVPAHRRARHPGHPTSRKPASAATRSARIGDGDRRPTTHA